MKFKNASFCLLLLFLGSSFSVKAQSTAVGKPMPQFKFFKLDDTPFTKSQITSGVKSIIIYFDPSCDHCQEEIADIGKRYNDFKNVSFYLVSANDKAQINTFMKTFGKDLSDKKNVTVLHDPNMEFFNKFSPTSFPAIYVYSFQGTLIKQFSGTTKIEDIL